MIAIRGAVVRLVIGACALLVLAPAGASAQAPPDLAPTPAELAPADEGFDCRASSVRLAADATDPTSLRLEPFVANRDVFPCVDSDSGAPSVTQIPGDAAPTDPRAIVGAAFARTRDGEPEPPGETPAPPETLGTVTAEAGAANVFLTNGEQVIAAAAVRSQVSVTCLAGQPVFTSRSELVGLTVGDPAPPVLVLPPEDDPATPDLDESHIHIADEEGPIHIGHSETVTDPATGITTHTRKALWLENGDAGDGGEIVVGEASVSIHGNPCTGRVTIVKNAVPNSAQDFTFTGLPGPADVFELDDDGTEPAGPVEPTPGDDQHARQRSFDVVPGSYAVTETVPTGFQQRDVSCVGDQGTAGAASPTQANVVVDDDPNEMEVSEDVTCTFLNISDAICPEGSVLNDAGQCVVTETQCPGGSTRVGDECIVDQTTCPGGSTEQGGQCVRNETTCPPGATFNAQGQCVVTEVQCPPDSTRNAAGQCVVTEVQCPPGSTRNAAGQCVSTQVVSEDVPRGGVVVPIDQVPGAADSICSRPGFGTLVAVVGTNGPDRITGTNRSDRIFAFGGADRVSGGRGNDCVEGGSGNDNLDGSNGNDALLGDTGRDILNGGTGRDLMEGGDGIDRLNGGSGNDRMLGGAARDKLSGGLGNDTLNGGPGSDFLEAGPGRDTVNGGPGNDAINVAESGSARDTVNCGAGRDTVRITPDDRVRNCERILVLRSPRRR